MATKQITRDEISKLAERLMARGSSSLMRGQPEQQIDLRIAAQVLSYMVESGMPVTSIEIDDLKNSLGDDNKRPSAPARQKIAPFKGA